MPEQAHAVRAHGRRGGAVARQGPRVPPFPPGQCHSGFAAARMAPLPSPLSSQAHFLRKDTLEEVPVSMVFYLNWMLEFTTPVTEAGLYTLQVSHTHEDGSVELLQLQPTTSYGDG